jgi:hypothetical protein
MARDPYREAPAGPALGLLAVTWRPYGTRVSAFRVHLALTPARGTRTQ